MASADVRIGRDNFWTDLKGKELEEVYTGIGFAAYEDGTASGKPGVTIRAQLADGKIVLVHTTLALFLTVAKGFEARYGHPE